MYITKIMTNGTVTIKQQIIIQLKHYIDNVQTVKINVVNNKLV